VSAGRGLKRAEIRMGADAERGAALPLGSFVAYNRLSGGTLEGKLF